MCTIQPVLTGCSTKGARDKCAKELHDYKMKCHPGFTIVFDNIDFEMKRTDMTLVNQNKDVHWVNHKMVKNRVSGNKLSWHGQTKKLVDVPNIKFLPTIKDHQKQRQNYIVLVSRILVDYFDSFSPLKDVCIRHIVIYDTNTAKRCLKSRNR